MLWNNNLILNKNLEIPYSESKNFKFEYIWEHSLVIKFDPNSVNIENLYCVIQSYLWNKDLICLKLYTGFLNKNSKKILNYSNVSIVKKMNFIYFLEWWDNIIYHDKFYMSEEDNELYGLILCFSRNSFLQFIKKNNLKNEDIVTFRPYFPWKSEITNHIIFFK